MDALIPQQVPQARFVLGYQQRNITHQVSEYLLSLTYTDHLTGKADSLQVELEDTQGKWRDIWYPGHGDALTLSLGWQGTPLRTLGRFEIDEVELNSPPSTLTIHALATGITQAVRTTEHQAYENLTLSAVISQIAKRLGLTLVGHIAPIKLDRLTQQTTDLAFLHTLAEQYDYAFKITGNQLVFHAINDLAKTNPVATFTLSDLANVHLRDQRKTIPKAIELKHQDPAKKQLITYILTNNQTVATPSSATQTTTSADTRKTRQRSTTAEQAKAQARAQQDQTNRQRTTGSWTSLGQPNLVSGNVITLATTGQLAGRYLITSSQHRITRNAGYTTFQQVCRIP